MACIFALPHLTSIKTACMPYLPARIQHGTIGMFEKHEATVRKDHDLKMKKIC